MSDTTVTCGAARATRGAAGLCGVVAGVLAVTASLVLADEPGGAGASPKYFVGSLSGEAALIGSISTGDTPVVPSHTGEKPVTPGRTHLGDMVGSLSCTSVSCHGGAESRQVTNEASGHSYVLWMGREAKYRDGRRGYDPLAVIEKMDGDPHALAGQRILEPRFQEVLKRASVRADGTSDAGMYAKCAACHDPHNEIHASAQGEGLITRSVMATMGIGCESCHGGGRRWLAEHYQRGVSRQRLKQLGMVDTKDLQVRARMCAGCHVGSANQDMNHDMIAAGHPPLRFEQASYEALIGRKHWDDRPRRAVEPEYEVQLWAAGRMAAAEAALALLEGRARRAREQGTGDRGQSVWPEFAEANCFACHQPLRSEVGRLPLARIFKSEAGVPAWQTWNVGLVDVVARGGGDSLADAMKRLWTGMEKGQVPDAGEIAALSTEARRSLEGIHEGVTRKTVLVGLTAHHETATWDELCQKLAALAAVERSMRDGGMLVSEGSRERVRRIAEALKFRQGGIEWPVVFEESSAMSMADVAREMEIVRRELLLVEESR